MRQPRLLLLGMLVLSLFFSPLSAAGRTPYFVVLPDGVDILAYSSRLEKMGAQIRLQMPPNVLTFDADSSLNINDAGPVARMYLSMVPLSDMSGYGPLAEAAAVQWNRDMMSKASKQGFRAAGAMRSLAAQSSLPSPVNLTASLDGNRVRAAWNGAAGATSYLVQLSKNPAFSDKIESIVLKTDTDLPRLETNGSETMYLRVRAVDGDLMGNWSSAVSISAPAFTAGTTSAAPTLSSPLDNANSDGFNVILEWMADNNASDRVQVSELASFSTTLVDHLATTGELTLPSAALKVGKTYFWRVRKWASDGSEWSVARRVVVTEPAHIENDAMINPEAPR